jgi:PKD repeat protein
MSIITGNKEFTRLVTGQQSGALLSAKDDILSCKYDLSFKFEYFSTNQNPVTIISANQLQLASGNWNDFGILEGDAITVVATSPTSGVPITSNLTVVSIMGGLLTHSGSSSFIGQIYPFNDGTISGTMSVTPTVANVERVDALFNLVQNNQNSALSLIDGEVNHLRFNVDGLAIGGTVSGVQIGNRSGGVILESQCRRIAALANFDFTFRVTIDFINWLSYEQGETTTPEWYNGNMSIKPYIQNSVYRIATNPNSSLILGDGFSEGNVGWYNENYNQGNNPFTFAIAFDDLNGNSLAGIRYNAPTRVNIQINGEGTFRDDFLAMVYRLNFDDEYKNNLNNFAENSFMAYVSDALNESYGVGSAEFVISDLVYINATPNECEIEFTINPTAAAAILLEDAGFDNRYLRLSATVQTTAGTATDNDRTTLLVWEGQALEAEIVGQEMTELGILDTLTHTNANESSHFTEDDLRATGFFELNKSDNYDAVGMKMQIVRDSDGVAFDLFSRVINAANFPLTNDNKRLFNYSEQMGYELPNPDRNEIRLNYTGTESPTTYQVAFNFPFIFSWRYWQPKLAAFNDFLDVNLPQNGKNDEWVRYLQLAGYSIRLRLELNKNGVIDFFNSPMTLSDYDTGDCTTVITIEDENGNTLPALIGGGENIIKAVHNNPNGWDLTSPWGWIAARPYESEARRLISTDWAWASNNNPLMPLPTQNDAELTIDGNDVIIKSRINTVGLSGNYTIVSRVGSRTPGHDRNVHKLETQIINLPQQATFEDRGFEFCKEPRLALGNVADCQCVHQNDVYGISLIADSLLIELEINGQTVPALGAAINFPNQPNASGFIIDWRQNLITYGASQCVKVKVTWTIAGISDSYYDSTWQLLPYSVTASEGTVQLYVNYDDLVKQDGINYTGSGFYTSIRFNGFFGNEQINSEHNNLLKSNDIRVKVRNTAAPSYDLITRPLTRCFTRPVKHMLLNASDIWVSDCNAHNHEEYKYYNVILSEESGIEFDGDEQFVRTLSCVLLDKNWKTESKFSDKQGAPPNISEIIANCATGGDCPPCEQMNVDFEADVLTAQINEQIQFTDLSDNSPTNWSWLFGTEGTSLLQNPTFAFPTTGLKDITLMAGNTTMGAVEIKQAYIEILAAMSQLDVILIAGQSNSCGRVLTSNASTPSYIDNNVLEDANGDPIQVFNGTDFEDFTFGQNGENGNGKYFVSGDNLQNWSQNHVAAHLISQNSANPILIIQVTEGGTQISIYPREINNKGSWNVDFAAIQGGSVALLEEFENRYTSLQAFAATNDIQLNPIALLWHQGEADFDVSINPNLTTAQRQEALDNYESDFGDVVSYFRDFTNNQELPIYYGTVKGNSSIFGNNASIKFSPEIQAAQLNHEDTDNFAFCRQNDTLDLFDNLHFDGLSNIAFGEWIYRMHTTPRLPLDLHPNADLGFALFKLNSDYTGNCIQVRRSSNSDVLDIGFDVNGNLDTVALLSFVGSGNGFVTIWYDQSGQGRNAFQNTSGHQPQIVENGVVLLENNKPTLRFDGTNDRMEITNFIIGSNYNDLCILATCKFDNIIGTKTILSHFDPTTNNRGWYASGRDNQWQAVFSSNGLSGTTNSSTVTSGSNNPSGQNIVTFYFNSLSSTKINIRRNANITTASTVGSANSIFASNTPIFIGATSGGNSNFMNGNIQSVILYRSEQRWMRSEMEKQLNKYFETY